MPRDGWTEDELNTYYYLLNRDEEEAAQHAIETNQRHMQQQRYAKQSETQDWAHDNLVLGAAGGTVSSILTSPMALWDWLGDLVQYGNTGLVMPRAELSPRDYANMLSAGAAAGLNDRFGTLPEDWAIIGGKGWGDAYQLGNSVLESMAWGGLTKGMVAAGAPEWLGAAVTNMGFFGSAASETTQNAITRGASPEQALWLGAAAGAAEALGETFSVEKLIHITDTGTMRRLLWNALAQGGIEASEEAFTTLINTVADAWIMGDKSEYNEKVRQNILAGMSREEAEKAAWQDWAEGIAQDALGGFLSGGVSGGVYGSANMIRGSRTEYSGTDRQALLDAALQMDPKGKAYQLAQKIQQQGTMSYNEALQLKDLMGERAELVSRDVSDRERADIQQRAESALKDAGVENPGAAAQLIAKEVSGEKLTREERRTLRGVQQAEQVSRELRQARNIEANLRHEAAQQQRKELREQKKGGNKSETRSFTTSASIGTAEKDSAVTVKGQEGEAKLESLVRGEDGSLKAKVTDAAGETRTVELDALDYGESGLDELVQELRGQQDAPVMFQAYSSGMGIGTFINGWNVAKAYGRNTSRSSAESIMGDGLLEGVDPNVIRMAFDYGRRLQQEERAQREKEQKEKRIATPPTEARNDSEGGERAAEGVGPYEKGEEKSKGGVSYEGGTVDGVKLKAVNQSRLNLRQRAQIEAVDMLGKTLGVRFALFESDLKSRSGVYANGMYKDGVIYLDVNAGRHGQSLSQVAMVRTAAHELTHYMQDYAEERYEELKQFLLDHLIEWKGKDLGELAAQKMQRDRTGKLSMEEALDEVVADGCEMMLRRTKVMQTMAAENKGLFRTVKNWLQKWLGTIKEAFLGVSEVHEEARAVAEMETERLEKLVELWDKGLLEAAENAQKSPAKEGGAVKYSSRERILNLDIPWDNDNNSSIKTQLSRVTHRIAGYNPVTSIEYDKNKQYYTDQLSDVLRTRFGGGKIERQDGISFLFDKESVATVRHYVGSDAEAAAAIAAPYVLKRGEIISGHKNHNNNGYPSLTFAASVELNGKKGVEAVVVLFAGKDRVHSLRITTLDGKEFVLDVKKKSDSEMEGAAEKTAVTRPTGSDSDNSILSSSEKSNTKFQERDALPDDRALLMTVKAEGRNAEALTAYQKKVKSLEALERKLQRQQAALEEAKKRGKDPSASLRSAQDDSTPSVTAASRRDSSPEGGAKSDQGSQDARALRKAAVEGWQEKIRKTEAQIRRAEKALDDMERSPQLRQETEKALAAWREANPQEAAKAIREMQQERESLKKYVELLRQEAKLTTPETRRMLPSDVRKLAQALVKEHGSSAAVDSITEKLQELGDFMVSNMEGGDVSYYNHLVAEARKIAKEIVNESYETIDDNKEIREGIRHYLRERTLNSEELRGDIPDFERWRKSHMGTLRLGKDGMSIDQAYQDLRSEYGEGLFPADVMAASDQIQQILDALDSVQPSYQQMFSEYESWQVAEALGNEIVDRLLSGEVRERESMADKAFRQRMKQLEEKYARKDKARQQALNDAEDQMKWERAKRDEAEERRREERALRRQLVSEKVHELRERSIERDKKYRARIAIDKKVVALSKIMLENSGKRHVPDAWKESIGGFLASIDTLSQHSGEKSRSFHLERILALQKMVAGQQARNKGEEGKDSNNKDSNNKDGKSKDGKSKDKGVFFLINPMIEEMLEPFVKTALDSDTGTITVENLELSQMRELEEILVALREAVDKADVMLADRERGKISENAGAFVDYAEARGKGKTGGMMRRFLSWDNLTPVYFFRRFGEAGEKVFRGLQRGWGKLAMNARQIIDFSAKTYSAKEAKAWERETHEFRLVKRESDMSGRESLSKAAAEGGPEAVKAAEEKNKTTVTLSTAQIMGLYCLS